MNSFLIGTPHALKLDKTISGIYYIVGLPDCFWRKRDTIFYRFQFYTLLRVTVLYSMLCINFDDDTKCPTLTRHRKYSCSGQTSYFITKYQINMQRGLKQNILPSLPSLVNKICYKKCSLPEAQLVIHNHPAQKKKKTNVNGEHVTTNYIPYVLEEAFVHYY